MPERVAGRTLVTAPYLARTDGYYPPELNTGRISPKSDVYSFGVVSINSGMAVIFCVHYYHAFVGEKKPCSYVILFL